MLFFSFVSFVSLLLLFSRFFFYLSLCLQRSARTCLWHRKKANKIESSSLIKLIIRPSFLPIFDRTCVFFRSLSSWFYFAPNPSSISCIRFSFVVLFVFVCFIYFFCSSRRLVLRTLPFILFFVFFIFFSFSLYFVLFIIFWLIRFPLIGPICAHSIFHFQSQSTELLEPQHSFLFLFLFLFFLCFLTLFTFPFLSQL